jgi:selenocysteine lyase/cysteine desulfurase
VFSPTDASLGSGLVTAAVAGWPVDDLQQRLWQQHRIITNVIREFNALRFSLAFFTSPDELDTALHALAEAASGSRD